MATPLPHKSFINRALNNHADILNIYNETIQSIDKLKNESPADLLFLLREANVFANDLNKVIYELANVTFKIDKSKHFYLCVKHIVYTLCELSTAIRKSFDHDYETVKNELKDSIKAATHIAERLLAVISAHDLGELKQGILNSQADVLFAVDRLRLCNLTKYLNPTELADVLHKPVDIMKGILLSFDPNQPNIKQKIIEYTNHALYKHQGCVDHIQRAVTSLHFNDEIKKLFLDIASVIHRYIGDMHQAFLRDSHFEQLMADCHQSIVEGVGGILKLIPLLDAKDNANVSNDGKELVLYIYGYSVACVYQLMRSLQSVKSDQ